MEDQKDMLEAQEYYNYLTSQPGARRGKKVTDI